MPDRLPPRTDGFAVRRNAGAWDARDVRPALSGRPGGGGEPGSGCRAPTGSPACRLSCATVRAVFPVVRDCMLSDPPAAAVPDSRTVAGFARHCFQRHFGTGSFAVCPDAALSRGRCRKRQGRVCADLPAARYAGGSGRRSVYRNANRAVLRCRCAWRRCRRRDGLDTSDDHPGRIPDARTSLHGAVPPGDGGRAVGAHVACRLDMGARPARAGGADSFDVGGLRLQIASDAPLLPAGQAGCRHASVRNPAGRRRTVRRAFFRRRIAAGSADGGSPFGVFPDSQSHEFPCRVAAVHGRRRRDTGADRTAVLRPTAPGGILRLAG